MGRPLEFGGKRFVQGLKHLLVPLLVPVLHDILLDDALHLSEVERGPAVQLLGHEVLRPVVVLVLRDVLSQGGEIGDLVAHFLKQLLYHPFLGRNGGLGGFLEYFPVGVGLKGLLFRYKLAVCAFGRLLDGVGNLFELEPVYPHDFEVTVRVTVYDAHDRAGRDVLNLCLYPEVVEGDKGY